MSAECFENFEEYSLRLFKRWSKAAIEKMLEFKRHSWGGFRLRMGGVAVSI